MEFAEAWPEIKRNLLASRRVRIPDYSEEALGFIGGGKAEVIKIEKLLGKKLPKGFAYYVEKLAPREDYMFEQIPMPFMPFFELYSSANLSSDIYPKWRESEKADLKEPFLIGDDSSNDVVLDLGHPYCPAYLSGELGRDLLAHSFVDFMRILSYRELQLTILDAGTDYEAYDNNVEDPRWADGKTKIKKKIIEIAPDCLEAWYLSD